MDRVLQAADVGYMKRKMFKWVQHSPSYCSGACAVCCSVACAAVFHRHS